MANIKTESNKQVLIWVFIVFALCFVAYAPALNNNFLLIWDDPNYITDNPDIRGLTLENIKAAFTKSYVGNYAPLHIISYAIEYSLFGLNPVAFHFVNNLLHSVNAILAMLLILRVSGNLQLSVLSALIFALHPIQVESVAWLTEQKNLLSTAFALVSFLTFILFLKNRNWFVFFLSLVLYAAALLTKISVVVIPVLLCLYIVLFERQKGFPLALTAPYFILALAASIAAMFTQQRVAEFLYHGGSFYATALTMITILVMYLRLFLFPVNLSPYYNPVIYEHLAIPVIVCSFILVGLAAVIWIKRKDREVVFFSGLAFISLIPVLQIIPISTLIQDRYLYLPLIGLAPLTVKFVRYIAGRKAWIIICILLVFMLTQTYSREKLWTDKPDMWLDAIQRHPESPILHKLLAVLYHKSGKLKDAYEKYQVALSLAPGDLELHQKYGALLLQFGQYEAALRELKIVYNARVKDEEMISNLAYAYMDTGDARSGVRLHKEVLSLNPEHLNSIFGIAMGYEKLGDLDSAVLYWKRFLDLAPQNNPWRSQAKKNLAIITRGLKKKKL